jgi:hypothetical protein
MNEKEKTGGEERTFYKHKEPPVRRSFDLKKEVYEHLLSIKNAHGGPLIQHLESAILNYRPDGVQAENAKMRETVKNAMREVLAESGLISDANAQPQLALAPKPKPKKLPPELEAMQKMTDDLVEKKIAREAKQAKKRA